MVNTLYSGIQHRHTDILGVTPSIPVDLETPELDNDLFDAEIFINTADRKAYYRANTEIVKIQTGDLNTDTYYLTADTAGSAGQAGEFYLPGTQSIYLEGYGCFRYEYNGVCNMDGYLASYYGNGTINIFGATNSAIAYRRDTTEFDNIGTMTTSVDVIPNTINTKLRFRGTTSVTNHVKWAMRVDIVRVNNV